MAIYLAGVLLDDAWVGIDVGLHDGCEVIVTGQLIEDACLKERVLRDMKKLNLSKTERIELIKSLTDEDGMLDSRHLLSNLEAQLAMKREREKKKVAFASDPTAHVLQKLEESGLSSEAKEQLITDMEDETGSVDLKGLLRKLDALAQWKKSIELVHNKRVRAAWLRWCERIKEWDDARAMGYSHQNNTAETEPLQELKQDQIENREQASEAVPGKDGGVPSAPPPALQLPPQPNSSILRPKATEETQSIGAKKSWPVAASLPSSWREILAAKQSELKQQKVASPKGQDASALDFDTDKLATAIGDSAALRLGVLQQQGVLSMLRLNELQRKKNGGTVFHEVDIDVIQGSRNVQNLAHEHLAQVEMLKQRTSDTRRVRVSLGDDKTTTNSSSASTRSNKVSYITVQGKAPGESFLLDREGVMKWYLHAQPEKKKTTKTPSSSSPSESPSPSKTVRKTSEKIPRTPIPQIEEECEGWLEMHRAKSRITRKNGWLRRYFRIMQRTANANDYTLTYSQDESNRPRSDDKHNEVLKSAIVTPWTPKAWADGGPREFRIGRWRLRVVGDDNADEWIQAFVAKGAVLMTAGAKVPTAAPPQAPAEEPMPLPFDKGATEEPIDDELVD